MINPIVIGSRLNSFIGWAKGRPTNTKAILGLTRKVVDWIVGKSLGSTIIVFKDIKERIDYYNETKETK
jgi:hypothetical protein